MRNMKRFVLVLTALLLTVPSVVFAGGGSDSGSGGTAVFNETGLPIVDQTMTFTIATRKRSDVAPFSEMQFWMDMEAKTGIVIDWNETPMDVWEEKKGLIFASGDLPDAIYGPWTLSVSDILTYSDQGLLLPLNDLIDAYAPNVQTLLEQRPTVRKSITAPDGNIYTLPSVRERGNFANLVPFINRAWLDKLGLEAPATMDELKDVLTAFKTQDPNGNGVADEIPLTFSGLKWPGIYPYFSAFGVTLTGGSNSSGWATISPDDESKVVWSTTTDEFKEGMMYLSDLYASGLIDVEVFTHNDAVKNAKVRDEPSIVGMYTGWSNTYAFGSPDESDYELLMPLEGPAGKVYLRWDDIGFNAVDGFTITTACENPEVLMRWANEQYDPLTTLQATEGIIGVHLKDEGNSRYSVVDAPDGYDSAEAWRLKDIPGVNAIPALIDTTFKMIIPSTDTQEKWDQAEAFAPYQTGRLQMPKMMYTLEENDVLLEYESEIVEYTREMYARWMVQGGIEDEFEDYKARLEAMGLNELLAVYQSAFDRFNGS